MELHDALPDTKDGQVPCCEMVIALHRVHRFLQQYPTPSASPEDHALQLHFLGHAVSQVSDSPQAEDQEVRFAESLRLALPTLGYRSWARST